MKRFIVITAFLCFATMAAFAQKVATYATGTPGTEDYESFGFWVKDGSRSFISYSYGADRKEAKITYAGKGTYNGVPCFKIQFGNKLVLYVMINGDQLEIAGNGDKYHKTFKWEYEGPVNGKGTACNVCVADAQEAIQLLKAHY